MRVPGYPRENYMPDWRYINTRIFTDLASIIDKLKKKHTHTQAISLVIYKIYLSSHSFLFFPNDPINELKFCKHIISMKQSALSLEIFCRKEHMTPFI